MALFILASLVFVYDEPSYVAEVKAIQKQVQAERKRIYSGLEEKLNSTSPEERNRLLLEHAQKMNDVLNPMMAKVLDLIKLHAGEKEAVDGLIWIAQQGNNNQKLLKQTVGLLRKHHLTHPQTLALTDALQHSALPWVSDFLRDQLNSPALPAEKRHSVLAALAVNLQKVALLSTMQSEYPQSVLKKRAQVEQTKENKEYTAEIDNLDSLKLEEEAVQRFTELKEKYPNGTRKGIPYSQFATTSIFEIQKMKVGMPAPELTGEDLDGVKFKLSDYRGKVVMISFWAKWCGPCMAIVPLEKEIAKKFPDRPFALIGVNADPSKKTAIVAVEKEGINWRSFWCGEKGPDADLPMSWNVTAWPTIYVVDHEGIIRVKHGSQLIRFGTALVDRIEELVKIAESKEK